MSRMSRVGSLVAALAVTGVLLIPASGAAADGPVAHKSGAIVNWVTLGKVKVRKHIQPLAVCSVACNITGTGVLKGLGVRIPFGDSGSFAANQVFGLAFIVKGRALKVIRQNAGRFRLSETLTATDTTTGATDTISRGFRLKR
jgi:hypothetical protein